MYTNNLSLQGPVWNTGLESEEDDGIRHFNNTIELSASDKISFVPLTRSSMRGNEDPMEISQCQHRTRIRTVLLPAITITVPIAGLSAALLALVFACQVQSEPSIFKDESSDTSSGATSYVLVNFPATRLVFAASFLSTLAPLLTSFVMTLWSLNVSAQMKEASTHHHFHDLPTPYQLSILIGLCLASTEQLRTYVWYSASRKRCTKLPPVLNKAAGIFIIACLLSLAVFVSDIVLHYLTSTIAFDQISSATGPMQQFGYGLSSLCLDLDRVEDNYGFPCSLPVVSTFTDSNRTAKRNEMYRLAANTSSVSQLWVTNSDNVDSDLVIMIPNPARLSAKGDFRASTVGVSTQCQLVPPASCNMTAFGSSHTNTQFNCSDTFFGVLGLSPNVSSVDGTKAVDSNLSPLGFKSAANLQWAFFTSGNLSTLYNPESWDPSTDQPDDLHVTPDSQLLNPFYLGVAMRVSFNTFTANSTIITDEPNVFVSNENQYLDLIMQCSIASYDLNYTWLKSSIQDVTAKPSGNGSLLEIFHGSQTYNSVSGGGGGGGFDLQAHIIEAAIAGPDTESFTSTWSNLYSVKVLSQIGAYLTPRTNLLEQSRNSLLVAKVPKSALGALIGCSLIYTLLGMFLVIVAWKATTHNVQGIAEQLSLAGLAHMAFAEGKQTSESLPSTPVSSTQLNTPNNSTSTTSISNHHLPRALTPKSETRKVKISGTDFTVC